MSEPDTAAQLARWAKQEVISTEAAQVRLNLVAGIQNRRFDLGLPPPEIRPRWSIGGKSICTPGNITVIQAQAGSGKSSFIGALLASRCVAMSGQSDCDCLGVTADTNATGKLLWLDTEQSAFDFHAVISRSLRRAKETSTPDWLDAYGLAGSSAKDLRQLLPVLMWHCRIDGLYGVVLDGFADFVCDVNDSEETDAFVAELHGLAIRYDCPLVGVLHENPGSENGKGRGHLGSQLERKAESVLSLKRDGAASVVFSRKSRRAPILEAEGPRFAWSVEAGMHVSLRSAGNARDNAKREKLHDLAEAVFQQKGGTGLRYCELVSAIGEIRGVTPSTAEDRFNDMKKFNVITKNVITHTWQLNPVTP